jgi:hypothetical protein
MRLHAMSLSRRVAAAFLLLALAWQASGLAAALERDTIVHCCCGDHSTEHKCDCPTCAGVGELRFLAPRRAPVPATDDRPAIRSCGGRVEAAALFQVLGAIHPFAPVALEALIVGLAIDFPAPLSLRDRSLEPVRPPP